MQAKKIVLIISFFLVVGLLFAVVFMARNQVGNFGKDYDRHVSTEVEKYVAWFTNERSKVYEEVVGFASDKMVSDFIGALYAGEDTTSYVTQIEGIMGKVSFLKKIQILDPAGIVLYSTKEGEALVNRFVPDLLNQAVAYQQSYHQPFLRFVSTNEFLVAKALQREEKTFHVVMYYDTARFSSPRYGLMVPWGKTILVSKRQKGQEEAAKIVEYASVDPSILGRGKKTIGGMKEVDGIQVVYFSRYENYVSGTVIGIIVFAFVLLFLILYTFFRLLQEEKLYKQPLTFRPHQKENLRDLVEDIEEGTSLSSEEAKKGIEEMLMSEDIEDLTKSSVFTFPRGEEAKEMAPFFSSGDTEPALEEPLANPESEEYTSVEEAFLSEPPLVESSLEEMETEIVPETKEKASLSEDEAIFEGVPSLSGVSAGVFQPDEATQLFAQQDRLLDELVEERNLSPTKEEDLILEPSFVQQEEKPSSPEEMILEPEFMAEEKGKTETVAMEEIPEISFDSIQLEKSSEGMEDLGEIREEPLSLELEPEVLSLGEEEISGVEKDETVSVMESEEVSSPLIEEVSESSPSASDLSMEEISLDTIEMPEISLEEVAVGEATDKREEMTQEDMVAESLLQEIPEASSEGESEEEVIALNMDELSAIPVEETAGTYSSDETTEKEASVSQPENKVVMFGEELHQDLAKLLSEPPKRISTIHDVPSYSQAAHDIAKTALGMNRVCILEKRGEKFENVMQDGFNVTLGLSTNDPLYKKVLSQHKSLDIQQNLDKASYLKQWFKDGELQNLEELFITPVIKGKEVVGIGIYGREKGTKEPSDLQKSELYNIGFLQEVE